MSNKHLTKTLQEAGNGYAKYTGQHDMSALQAVLDWRAMVHIYTGSGLTVGHGARGEAMGT